MASVQGNFIVRLFFRHGKLFIFCEPHYSVLLHLMILQSLAILSPIKWSVHCHNSTNTAPIDLALWQAADRIQSLIY